MNDPTKAKLRLIGEAAWTVLITCIVAALLVSHCSSTGSTKARGLSGVGGGNLVGGGGGITSVVADDPLTGSGSAGSHLGLSLHVDSPLSGTGSAGSHLTVTEVGDISSVTAGTSLSGGGTSGAVTLNLNMPGGTCSNGQAVTSINSTGTATCGDSVPNQYGGTHLEWVDEWMTTANPATGGAIGSIYACTSVNGACNTLGAGTGYAQTRPGILENSTGTTNTSSRSYITTSGVAIDFRVGSWAFEWTGGWEVLSTGTTGFLSLIGFFDVTNGAIDQADGCFFAYDERNVLAGGPNSGNVNALECWCSTNSTRTSYLINASGNSDESFALGTGTIAALTAPSTNIYTLKIVMTGTTRAEFFRNGTKVCDINTNIPNAANRVTGAGWGIQRSAGTTPTSTMETDRTRLVVDMTATRSP